ncbi:phage/plasmid primase, P4 family [Methanococcoides sp. FTZ1]|uniref:phage/plasmid primase, P4 family n=1 Tax=Methanococcoides sp. FTZ1 TaxID=3439061 RepID=UPI003F85D861
MSYDRALIDEIKSKLDIVQVISETIHLKQVGNTYRGATSATSKSGASLIVDPKKQIYNNTATEDGGDVLSWIAYTEGLNYRDDFPQVLSIAAEKAGVQLPTHDPVQASEKAELYPFMRAVAGFYHSNLTDEHRHFIHEKWGISNEMIDQLMIGWAPKDNTMQREMRDLFDRDTIEKSGLVYVNENKLTDIFKGRIIFPYWKGDNVVYFIGRDLDPKATRKYFKQLVHTEERPYISECIDNGFFYGEDSIKRADSVIITEGVTDCIKVLQEGLACISPVTVRIKESQKEYAYELVKNKSEVIVCNDNEENETGKNGAIATAEYLESKGVQVRLIELPRPDGVDKIDLADYLQDHTKEDFEKLDSNNVWEIKLRNQNIPSGTVEKIRAVIRFIQTDLKMMDPVMKQLFIENDVAEYFQLKRNEVNRILKSSILKEEKPTAEDDSFFTQSGKLRVKKLAEHLMTVDRFITFEDTKKTFYYCNGVYVPNGEDVIARNVQNIMGDASKKHHIAEIINFIQLETLIPRSQINHDIRHINLLNGVYNLETGELEEHNPDNISIVQIPVKFDSDATCPKIEQFMKDVLRPEDFQVMYEFIGYCLIPDTRIEKSVMLLGKGANGKSVMLAMLGEFLGGHNTSCESLHMLEKDPYSPAELYGKLANIFPDLASGAIYENSTFKMLTGNEKEIRAQRKFEHPFKFKNTARLIFSANDLPPVPGDDFAYFRRWILLEFPNQFIGDNCDRDILSKITTEEELSGLLNLVIPALKGLLEMGEYSYNLTQEQVRCLYKINSDPIAAFADECVVYSESYTVKAVMYNEYIVWCQSHGIDPLAANMFSKRFIKLGYFGGRESSGERLTTWENCVCIKSVKVPDFNPDVKNQEQETNPSGCQGSKPHCSNMQNKKHVNTKNNSSHNVTIGKKPWNPDGFVKIDNKQDVKARQGKIPTVTNPDVSSDQSKTADDRVGGVRPETKAFLQKLLTKPMSHNEAVEACRTHGIANPKGPIEFLMGTSRIIETEDGMLRWV